ncbi:MAG TPA: cupin domain-containing protein [Xanthobacteraceae bacterium]|nr:cupin domain-containing protein [Xanthobacteraceae bacterium]
MGRVVTFAELEGKPAGQGVRIAPVTAGETREMTAEYVRIDPGAAWSETAPAGSDCYLFTADGSLSIAAGAVTRDMRPQSFATVEEGTAFTVRNVGGAPAGVLKIIAPPQPASGATPGFKGGLTVAARATTPVVPVPEEHKQRIYFVGHGAARSERGHAMIVVYDGLTNTALHHHPNADSLFMLLDGAVQFTVNGKPVVVTPGQAAYFPANDQHQLHTAPGHAGASFLEFHIPAAYKTVKA